MVEGLLHVFLVFPSHVSDHLSVKRQHGSWVAPDGLQQVLIVRSQNPLILLGMALSSLMLVLSGLILVIDSF